MTMKNVDDLLQKALRLEWLTAEEGVFLFENRSEERRVGKEC